MFSHNFLSLFNNYLRNQRQPQGLVKHLENIEKENKPLRNQMDCEKERYELQIQKLKELLKTIKQRKGEKKNSAEAIKEQENITVRNHKEAKIKNQIIVKRKKNRNDEVIQDVAMTYPNITENNEGSIGMYFIASFNTELNEELIINKYGSVTDLKLKIEG